MPQPYRPPLVAALLAVLLVAGALPAAAIPEGPAYPSPAWAEREAANYARTRESPEEHAGDPAFQRRVQEQGMANEQEYLEREVAEPYWRSEGNLCASWGDQCVGDPFRYPGVDPFYDLAGEVTPVELHDAQGARLNGRVWAPKRSQPGDGLPGVVIVNGSVQAPETLYWWLAQSLVREGYLVMTFDPRGQGRSDSATPDGTPGSNVEASVFRTNLVDAIDFFLSTPEAPYPHEGNGPPGTPFNPYWERLDPERIGAAGHSAGAAAVTVVQGLEPWPGVSSEENPIDAIVALDNLGLQVSSGELGVLPGSAPTLEAPGGAQSLNEYSPRVPAMGQAGDYFLTPTPYTEPPDPEQKKAGFSAWQEAGVPSFQVQVQAGTHYEFSLLPEFPATSWSYGNAMAQHYALAWLDRWLKETGEPGFGDADARLLDDTSWRGRMSFYLRSARDYPDRAGARRRCEDIRAGCADRAGRTVERIAGTDRLATAAALARRTFARADTVVVARADQYPDALAGGPLATALDAPLVLTSPTELSPSAASAIEALDAREVVLLGGEAALAPAVAQALRDLHLEVRRVSGPDRFGTAAAIADELGETATVFLAEGADPDPSRGWPDALAAAGLASVVGAPVLLTTTEALPPATAERLEGRDVLLVGGTAAVGPEVEAEARDLAASVRRIAGGDRYATAALVGREALARGIPATLTHVATGTDWPDSLVAGAATGDAGGLLAVVDGDRLAGSPSTRDLLAEQASAIESLRVVGGTAAVSEEVLDALEALVAP